MYFWREGATQLWLKYIQCTACLQRNTCVTLSFVRHTPELPHFQKHSDCMAPNRSWRHCTELLYTNWSTDPCVVVLCKCKLVASTKPLTDNFLVLPFHFQWAGLTFACIAWAVPLGLAGPICKYTVYTWSQIASLDTYTYMEISYQLYNWFSSPIATHNYYWADEYKLTTALIKSTPYLMPSKISIEGMSKWVKKYFW